MNVSGEVNGRGLTVAWLGIGAAVLLADLLLAGVPARAQDAIWIGNADDNFDNPANWSPTGVPTGIAFFEDFGPLNVTFDNAATKPVTTVGGWTFTTAGRNYIITLPDDPAPGPGPFPLAKSVVLDGDGITVDAGKVEIVIPRADVKFSNASTAGEAAFTLINGGLRFEDLSSAGHASIVGDDRSSIRFSGTSTAGNATISQAGPFFTFRGASTAGNATIDIGADSQIYFENSSIAGDATINSVGGVYFRDNSRAHRADITVGGVGGFFFSGSSTASRATLTNNYLSEFRQNATAGLSTITNTFVLFFADSATGGSSTIDNAGLVVDFIGNSTAANAFITTRPGARTRFLGTSNAGVARFVTERRGWVDFSDTAGPGLRRRLTAGSIAGAGDYYLGSNHLGVGFDDRSTQVSGVISDCGPTGTECLAGSGGGSSLTKIGTGILTLSGENTYTGRTYVRQGTLVVNGSLVSPILVTGEGRLRGTGILGPTTILGLYAPGASIGTQTINGDFTLGSGAVYEAEVNAAGQGDKVIVKGTVDLTGATLRVLAEDGNYQPRTDYTIIDNDGSDSVIGTFASVSSNLPFVRPAVAYQGGDGNDVVLTLLRNDFGFCGVTETQNQCSVANALDRFPIDNPLFLSVLTQTAAGARRAFDALSGEVHATVAGTLADDSRYVREAVLGRLMQANATGGETQLAALAAAGPQVASLDANAMALGFDGKSMIEPAPAPLAFWTRAYGAWGDFNGDGNAATADRDLGGFVSGMDAQISGSWRAGLATGASFANVSVSDRYSAADMESYTLGGYVGGMAGAFALRGGGMWAWNDVDTSRAVVFPGFFERQKASYDADTGQLFGEVAYPTQMAGMAVEPFAGLALVSIDGDSFRERGGALASLRGSSTDEDVGYSTLGLRAATTMHWGATLVTPHVSVGWQHAFDDVTPGAALAFASTGIGFDVTGVPLAQDSALIDAGLNFALGTNTTAGVSYTGQFGGGVSDNGVKGRLTWLF